MKARQNLKKRIRQETDIDKKARLVDRRSEAKERGVNVRKARS